MKLVILSFLLVLTCFTSAQTINKETAEIVAKNFYLEKQKRYSANNNNTVQFVKDNKSLKVSPVSYYVLNVENQKGFIIVSGSKDITPILAYSLTGNFDQESMPPAVKDWMEAIDSQIKNNSKFKSLAIDKIKNEWEKYTNPDFENYLKTQKNFKSEVTSVPPLLSTTWNQGCYYNTLCPACTGGGSDNHVWTGCVATAQAQVMKYYNYPAQGVGEHSYTHWQYGLQSANFGGTTYNWASMPSSLSAYNNSVATLMYHCGVSVNMNYSPSGSGASGSAPRTALINYFKYSDNALYTSKYSYSDENWIRLLKAEIDKGRPIYYVGYGSDGHAFVCDGYQDNDYFHFNWGWGGSYDGYFIVSSLNPGGYNFTNSQSAIVGVLPSTMEQRFDSVQAIQLSCGQLYSGSTSNGENHANLYNNSSWNETGKEKLHKITTTYRGRLCAKITNTNGIDLDVFILKYANRNTCLASGDSLAIVDDAEPGTYYILVDGKFAAEGNYSLTVICPDNKVDLVVNNGRVEPTSVIPGGIMQVSSIVSNIGNTAAIPNLLYYYLSNDKILSGEDIFLGSNPISTLPVGSKLNVTNLLTLPAQVADGNKYIIFKIDANNLIDETDEDLNTFAAYIQIPKQGSLDCSDAVTLNNNIVYNGNSLINGNSVVNNYSCNSGLTNKEVIHKFTPNYSGLAEIEFKEDLEGTMYMILLTGCNENACTNVFANYHGGGGEANGGNIIHVIGGITYYLVADGNSNMGVSEGPYTIKVKFPEECPKPVISSTGTNKCVGDPDSYLYTNYNYPNFLWKKDNSPIPGATNSSLSVSDPGSYTVEITENNCIGISDPVNIAYSLRPEPVIISALSDTNFCEGYNVQLHLTTGQNYSYQWTCNNISIPGANELDFYATESGKYKANVTRGACTVQSNGVDVITYASALDQGNALKMKMSDLISYWPFNSWGYDESGNNNYMSISGAIQVKDKENNYSAFKLDGIDDYMYTSKQYVHPDIFTISLWFKTATGGKILGFDEQQTNRASVNADRHIYIDNSGLLYFGLEDGSKYTIHTTQSYKDDQWHLATATLSSAGIKLYVDGQLKAQQSSPTNGKNYSGYWKVGYGDLSGWTGNPGNVYFNGSVDNIVIYSKELTADEIKVLYQEQYLNIYCSKDVICGVSGTSSIDIENSEPGITYQLYNHTTNNPIGSGVSGNSGTISLGTGTLSQTTQIKIKALNNNTQCEKQLDSIFTITVGSSISPQISISSNASQGTFCKGDSLVFNSSILYGGSAPVYVWKINGVPIGISNSQFISASLNHGDQVSLQITSSISCASPQTVTSNAINVSLSALPDKTITVTGNSPFCEGESVTLHGVQTSVMEWYKIGIGKISTSNPLIINEPGDYFLYIENSHECWSISDTLEFTMKDSPDVNLGQDASIYTNEDLTLDAGQASSYLWSTSETTQSIIIDGSIGTGNYTYSVEATGENGCKDSDTIHVEVLSVLGFDDKNSNMKTIVFPNPSTEYLFIEFDEAIKGDILLELITGRGQKVLRKECTIQNNGQREKLDLQGLSKGIYYLKLTMGDQIAFYKIVIN